MAEAGEGLASENMKRMDAYWDEAKREERAKP
jgi:hypothetical protein